MPRNNYDEMSYKVNGRDINFEDTWAAGAADWREDGLLTHLFSPGKEAFDEWSAQMVSTMYENDWNSAQAQMERGKEAGINPNLLAAGIAGADGSSIASAPNSSSGTGASSLGSLASAVGSIASAAGVPAANAANIAKAGLDAATAEQVARNAEVHRRLEAAQTTQALMDAGVSEQMARGFIIDNRYKGAEHEAELWVKSQQFANMQEEWFKIQADYKLKMKELEWYDDQMTASIDLMTKQSLNEAKQALKNQYEAEYQQLINNFWIAHNFDPNSPTDMALRQLFVDNPELYQQVLGILQDSQYRLSLGTFNAESETAYSIAFARQNGQNASDVMYYRVGSWGDCIGRVAKLLGDIYSDITNKIDNLTGFPKANAIRKEITDIINNAYIGLEKYPQDAEHYNKVISDFTAALQLNNNELIQWYEKK